MEQPKRLSWGPGASWDDAARDLTLPELIQGLKERNDRGLWDAFFDHMDSLTEGVAPGADVHDARMDYGDEEAAEMARKARIEKLKYQLHSRLRTLRGRF